MGEENTKMATPIPVTIVTGFLGSGKTTLLLNLIPQLPSSYRLALLKNEFGDVAIDSQLASEQSISGVRELLNGCICCNLVGQLGDALTQLRDRVQPDRIIIETSGSAFPATLAMEVNRLSTADNEAATKGKFVLDGVISVIDVENWEGYEDTSYTAKMQARYTDLVVFNKWELVPEQRFDICLDRLADLELDPPTPWVRSDRGRVDKDVLLGIDGALLAKGAALSSKHDHNHDHAAHGNGEKHNHANHQSEVEVLSVTLKSSPAEPLSSSFIDLTKFSHLLQASSKEEVYRIKGTIRCSPDQKPLSSDPTFSINNDTAASTTTYILNWAFGRWTYTPSTASDTPDGDAVARLTFILARYESGKWTKKLETGNFVACAEGSNGGGELKVEKLL